LCYQQHNCVVFFILFYISCARAATLNSRSVKFNGFYVARIKVITLASFSFVFANYAIIIAKNTQTYFRRDSFSLVNDRTFEDEISDLSLRQRKESKSGLVIFNST